MLEHMSRQGVTGRLELVLVDRGVTVAAARAIGRDYDLEIRRVGWDDKQPTFRPIRHAWRVEVAHGRLGRSRRLAKSFENTTTSATGWLQVACIATTLSHSPKSVEAAVLKCRREQRRGQDWIGPELGIPARTVGRRILRRHQVPTCATATDHRRDDPLLEGHRGPLRADRPGELVHMDVKKLGRIPDGGGWRAHGRPMGSTGGTEEGPDRLRLRPLRSSTTTPGSPTPRSCPTRRAPPARPSWPGPRLTSPPMALSAIERRDDRQPLQLQELAATSPRCSPTSAPGTSSSSRTARGRTARSSASTAPCRPSGPTARSSPPTPNAQPPLRPGWSTTTLDVATARSAASHRSADCHQPDGRVQLDLSLSADDYVDLSPGPEVSLRFVQTLEQALEAVAVKVDDPPPTHLGRSRRELEWHRQGGVDPGPGTPTTARVRKPPGRCLRHGSGPSSPARPTTIREHSGSVGNRRMSHSRCASSSLHSTAPHTA